MRSTPAQRRLRAKEGEFRPHGVNYGGPVQFSHFSPGAFCFFLLSFLALLSSRFSGFSPLIFSRFSCLSPPAFLVSLLRFLSLLFSRFSCLSPPAFLDCLHPLFSLLSSRFLSPPAFLLSFLPLFSSRFFIFFTKHYNSTRSTVSISGLV